jgi:ribonucleotide monophosphatase NagD (HAD superfamily)
VALQKGRYFVREEGYFLDTGAFVAMLEYSSGKTARVLGKPSQEFFHLALSHVGCTPAEAAIVGDDINTDIAGAARTGALGVLVA